MAGLWDLLNRFKTDWRLAIGVLIADLAGMVFGWYYYWDVGQFDPSSQYFESYAWWPLVADSPNAVLLFFAAVLLYLTTGKRSKWLDGAAFITNVYVGLWTSFLFLSYPERMGTWDWGSTNNILFFAHLGMPLQALVLVPDMRRDRWAAPGVAVMTALAAAFVWVDYWGPHIHPAPFLHTGDGDSLLHLGSPLLMVIAVAAWFTVLWIPRAMPSRPSPPQPT